MIRMKVATGDNATVQYPSPRAVRAAKRIEGRLVKLIDGGEDLERHYYHAKPGASCGSVPGRAVVIGQRGFKREIVGPSMELDRHLMAPNAIVFRDPSSGCLEIRLRDSREPDQWPAAHVQEYARAAAGAVLVRPNIVESEARGVVRQYV